MNRVLRRPMFRIGGSAGTGITSGLDQPRKQYAQGSEDRFMELVAELREQGFTQQEAIEEAKRRLDMAKGGRVGYANGTEMPNFQPSGLPGFLTSFGLNLLSTPPQGNIFQTAAVAAQDPFRTLQAQQAAAMKTASDRAFAKELAQEEREFDERQLEKRLAVEREKIAAGDEFSLNQLTQLYLDNYQGDPNAQIKASNHANYIKNILPELRGKVGDTQIGGIVEEDLSDVDKATKFAKRNKNKIGKIFYDVNSGTLKKLVRDEETRALGFVPFDMSTPMTPDTEGEFLPEPKKPPAGLFGQETKPDKTFKEVFNIEDDSDFGIGFYD